MSEAAATATSTVGSEPRATRREGLSRPGTAMLLIVLSGAFMVVLDFFIVMVTLPAIRVDLGASGAQLQLVVTGYGVAIAAGLITGGRLGDRFGRRRMFCVGLCLFVLTSAACGFAVSPAMLIAARVAQGLSGALLQPQVLAILGSAYHGPARARAFAAYAMAMGAAGVLGQLIGGALIQADIGSMGWRTCFLINVPVGVLALALAQRHVPRLRPRQADDIDVKGMALVAVLLTLLITPLIEGRQQAWPAWSLVVLGASVPAAFALLWQQRRLSARGGRPLLAPDLIRRRSFTSALLAVMFLYAGTASFYFVLALYLYQGLHLSSLASGAMFSVLGVGFVGTSMLVRPIAAWTKGRHLELGAVVLALGHGLQAGLVASGAVTWWAMLPLLLLQGAGLGLVMAPLASSALIGVPAPQAGLASGLLGTVQHTGNALGVAVIGLLFYGVLGQVPEHAAARGFTISLLYLMGLALALGTLLWHRGRRMARG